MPDLSRPRGVVLPRRQFLGHGLGFGALVVGLTGCSGFDSGSSGEGILQFAVTDTSRGEQLDPLQSLNQHHAIYCSMIWDFLIDFEADYTPKPRLARRIESDSSAQTWTIELRDDVRWHDGSRFEARDVAWTLERILDKRNGSPSYGYASGLLDESRIEINDRHTLVCHLKTSDALFPQLFAQHGSQIVKDGWEPDGIAANATGTGPFIAERWKAGDGFEVRRNPNYWRGNVRLEGARSVVIPEVTSKITSVLSGQSHVSDAVSPAQVEMAKGIAGIEVDRAEGLYFAYLTMDASQEPFDNNDVRMAFKLAANRSTIVDNAFQGFAMPGADCSTPVGSPMFPPGLAREQDVTRAKLLLARAGFPNGLDVELITAPVLGGLNDFAVTYAAAANEADIRVSIKQWPADTYFDEVWLKKPFYADYLGRAHPLKALQNTFLSDAPWNETRVAHTKIDGFVERALRETDPDSRNKVVQEAMRWQADNEGIIMPGLLDKITLRKSTVRGVTDAVPEVGRGPEYAAAWIEG